MLRPVRLLMVLTSSDAPAALLPFVAHPVRIGGVELVHAVPGDRHVGVARERDHRGLAAVGRDVQQHHGVGVVGAAVPGGPQLGQLGVGRGVRSSLPTIRMFWALPSMFLAAAEEWVDSCTRLMLALKLR